MTFYTQTNPVLLAPFIQATLVGEFYRPPSVKHLTLFPTLFTFYRIFSKVTVHPFMKTRIRRVLFKVTETILYHFTPT